VPQLRVIARTSSFSFKGKEVDITEIARKLNVAHVLEGSVRKSGDTLRITAQLIRTSDSSHLWSQTYDRPMTDVFKVQDEIAAAVVEQLKIKLLGNTPKTKTTDPKAYALYLQAREINRQYTTDAFSQAITLYRQALAIDPGYAAAWADLAYTHIDQVINGVTPAEVGIPLARDAIEQALTVDPHFARAHAARGWAAILYERDLATAAQSIERALAIEPNNPEILNIAAILARRLARLDLAIAIGEYQASHDPLNTDSRADLALAYRYAGHLDDALEQFHSVLRLRPGFLYAHAMIGEILLQKGDAKAALVEFRQEEDGGGLAGLAMAYHALGQHSESDAAMRELNKVYARIGAHTIASVLAFRGESDAAFEWLERAAANRDPAFGSTMVYPAFTNLHSDPRWLPFLRQHGMAPEQLAAIKFDVTLPN
jgi:tetratricopeptide (TPR) repeat protein